MGKECSVYLMLGSNMGDRNAMLIRATDLIRQRIGSVVCISRCYETAPWGVFGLDEKPQNFYNQAVEVRTTLSPHDVLREAMCIEWILGRRRKEGGACYASRPIDIDIILYDNLVTDTPDLTIPHPRMHLRRFVLEPMCDIAPHYIHPQYNKPLSQLLEECPDTSSCFCCS